MCVPLLGYGGHLVRPVTAMTIIRANSDCATVRWAMTSHSLSSVLTVIHPRITWTISSRIARIMGDVRSLSLRWERQMTKPVTTIISPVTAATMRWEYSMSVEGSVEGMTLP